MKILGIESSCDETAAAVLCDGREILSSVIASQIEIHRRFGGVVPEIASRNHTLAIRGVVDDALARAGLTINDIDAIGVTYGAGLVGALLVGVNYAKGLAYAAGKPLYAINHIQGHIAANYISHKELTPPYLCLVASGGHTALIRVKSYTEHIVLGSSVDDACGESFDKVARILGLPYPGGPEIERVAKDGIAVIEFPKAFKRESHFNFSYSGLKTSVVNYVHNKRAKGEEINVPNVAASFEKVAVEMLVETTIRAARKYQEKKIAIAGGVGANSLVREMLTEAAVEYGIEILFPPLELCTDNAAMIAAACYFNVRGGAKPADLNLNAKPNLKINEYI